MEMKKWYFNNRLYLRVFLMAYALIGLLKYPISEPFVIVAGIDFYVRGVPVVGTLLSVVLMSLLGLLDTLLEASLPKSSPPKMRRSIVMFLVVCSFLLHLTQNIFIELFGGE